MSKINREAVIAVPSWDISKPLLIARRFVDPRDGSYNGSPTYDSTKEMHEPHQFLAVGLMDIKEDGKAPTRSDRFYWTERHDDGFKSKGDYAKVARFDNVSHLVRSVQKAMDEGVITMEDKLVIMQESLSLV